MGVPPYSLFVQNVQYGERLKITLTDWFRFVVSLTSLHITKLQVIQIDRNSSEETEFWESYNSNIAEMAKGSPKDVPVVAHVCQNFVCRPPVTDADALRALLAKTSAVASSS